MADDGKQRAQQVAAAYSNGYTHGVDAAIKAIRTGWPWQKRKRLIALKWDAMERWAETHRDLDERD